MFVDVIDGTWVGEVSPGSSVVVLESCEDADLSMRLFFLDRPSSGGDTRSGELIVAGTGLSSTDWEVDIG